MAENSSSAYLSMRTVGDGHKGKVLALGSKYRKNEPRERNHDSHVYRLELVIDKCTSEYRLLVMSVPYRADKSYTRWKGI